MEVPCVVTDIRGCREAVEHDRNGLMVPLRDVQALVDAMMALLTKPELARRLAKEGRRMAVERFDERMVFEKVKSEYRRLLRAKGFTVNDAPSGANADLQESLALPRLRQTIV